MEHPCGEYSSRQRHHNAEGCAPFQLPVVQSAAHDPYHQLMNHIEAEAELAGAHQRTLFQQPREGAAAAGRCHEQSAAGYPPQRGILHRWRHKRPKSYEEPQQQPHTRLSRRSRRQHRDESTLKPVKQAPQPRKEDVEEHQIAQAPRHGVAREEEVAEGHPALQQHNVEPQSRRRGRRSRRSLRSR